MSKILVPDAGGDTITVLDVDGCLFPMYPVDAIRGITSLKLREDDVMICAFPKSGTHWVWEIVRLLVAGTLHIPDVDKGSIMLEHFTEDYFSSLPSPRILNTHVRFHKLPSETLQKNCKIIYVLRNPKDQVVSFYNHHRKLKQFYHYEGSWENYLPCVLEGKFDYGSWFDYVREWENAVAEHQELPVLTLCYEDIKEDPIRETKKICAFLGMNPSELFLEAVCQKSSFEDMKKRLGPLAVKCEGGPWNFRKGTVGDWKNWFTVSQNEWFDRLYEEKMKESSLKFRYSI